VFTLVPSGIIYMLNVLFGRIRMQTSELYTHIKTAVVAFALPEGRDAKHDLKIFGSGFCVDSQGIILTARHVVARFYQQPTKTNQLHSPPFYIIFFRKEVSSYGAFWVPPIECIFPRTAPEIRADVAALRIQPSPQAVPGGWPSLELSDLSDIYEGQEVATCGYPLKTGPDMNPLADFAKGTLSRIDQYIENGKWRPTRLVLNMAVNPGNSGGPVFNTTTGKVLGLISTETMRSNRDLSKPLMVPAGMAYCVPSTGVGCQ